MIGRRRYPLLLAVYLSTRGYAFVLLEGHASLLDWGTKQVYGPRKSEKCILSLQALFAAHQPDIVVIQDTGEDGTKRVRRVRLLNHQLFELAQTEGAIVAPYSRKDVQELFLSRRARGKDGIALEIARIFPQLQRFVPPLRKAWMTEAARMAIFDAAALAFVFYERNASSAAA